MNKLKVFSTFSGVGGLDLPFHNDNNFEVIGFSEIDKHASAVLNYLYPEINNYGDITKISLEELPDFDVLTGGSPCQDVSVAGKRVGLGGERSGLFRTYVEILKAKQPRYFVFENVKGMFSSQEGWDFAEVQIALAEAGYDVRFELLNAKEFGVPQNRERVFIIGSLRGESGREILSESGESRENSKAKSNDKQGEKSFIATKYLGRNGSLLSEYCPTIQTNDLPHIKTDSSKVSLTDAIPAYEQGKGRQSLYKQQHRVYSESGVSPSLCTYKDKVPHIRAEYDPKLYDTEIVYNTEGISPCLRANKGGSSRGSVLVKTGEDVSYCLDSNYAKGTNTLEKNRRQLIAEKGEEKTGATNESVELLAHSSSGRSWGREERIKEGEANTLNTGEGCRTQSSANYVKENIRIRRLTPLECERLMGWNDERTRYGIYDGEIKEISDTQRYKMCGNGVVPQCVEPIKELILTLNKEK